MTYNLLLATASLYVAVMAFKAFLSFRSIKLYLNAMIRARFRTEGRVTLPWFVFLLGGYTGILLGLLVFWPVILWLERRSFWFPYNGFSMARQCMRVTIPHVNHQKVSHVSPVV